MHYQDLQGVPLVFLPQAHPHKFKSATGVDEISGKSNGDGMNNGCGLMKSVSYRHACLTIYT